jgi:hypothetical protein
MSRQAELLLIIHALCPLRLFFGGGEGGQQHAGKDCYDRDDDEQFDKREGH